MTPLDFLALLILVVNLAFIASNIRERRALGAQKDFLRDNPPYMKCPAEGCGITVLGSSQIDREIHMLCIMDAQAAVKRRELESAHDEALAIEHQKQKEIEGTSAGNFSIKTEMIMADREPANYWKWSKDKSSGIWYRYKWRAFKNGFTIKDGYAATDEEAIAAATAIVDLHKKAVVKVINH